MVISSNCFHLHFTYLKERDLGPRAGGEVLRIQSDGDDRRILGGLKFSIPGFLGGEEYLASIFSGGMI